jgi:hypothetical protein
MIGRCTAALAAIAFCAAFAAPASAMPLSPTDLARVAPGPITEIQSRNIVCTMEYRPVCAERRGRRQTYSNACHARRDGARVIHSGECRAGSPRYRWNELPRDWSRRGCVFWGGYWVCRQ